MNTNSHSSLYFVGVATKHQKNQPLRFAAAASATQDHKGNIPFEVCANQHLMATESAWEEDKPFQSLGFKWLLARRKEWIYIVVGQSEYHTHAIKGCMKDLIQEWSPSIHKANGIDRCATILLRWGNGDGGGGSQPTTREVTEDEKPSMTLRESLRNSRNKRESLADSRNQALEAVRQSRRENSDKSETEILEDEDIDTSTEALGSKPKRTICSGCDAGGAVTDTLYSMFSMWHRSTTF